MIVLKNKKELSIMREAGKISARALKLAGEAVEPGVSTKQIDDIVRKYIISQGARPSFLGYNNYPASACISLNSEVIHGIPSSSRILKSGDIVSIDVGAEFNNYHGDNAWTFACGDISKENQDLLNITRESLYQAIKISHVNNRIGDISHSIEQYVEQRGYSVVRDFVGHGIGTHLHEEPSVPNYGKPGHGARLCAGMTIAIEPMINIGTHEVKILDDDWTVVTRDNKNSAHFEHTIAITENGPVILTDPS